MINLYHYKGIAIQKHDKSEENFLIDKYCKNHNIPLLKINNKITPPDTYIPLGNIPYSHMCLNKIITPDYFPEFTKDHLHRKVWKSNEWIFQKLFVKPADKHKRFDGFITKGTYSKKKKPPFWYSEVVHFTNEWRYYITQGKLITAKWYDGIDKNTAPPNIPLTVPKDFSGTLDFGTINDKLALVEAHQPLGVGWYGSLEEPEAEIYLQWAIDGWMYMINY